MNNSELKNLGREAIADLTAAFVESMRAGAARFRAEMADLGRENEDQLTQGETDGLLLVAEKIEVTKADLKMRITAATGLKKLALAKHLARVEAAEAALARQVEADTAPLQLAYQPATDLDADAVKVRRHRRRKPALAVRPDAGGD